MMTCEQFNEMLDNFENLNEAERLEMNKHAAECESCRADMDFLLSIIEATKSLPKIEPPSDFMDRLNIRLDAEEEKKNRIANRILRSVRTNWRQYAAAAACFALVAVVTSNGKMLVDRINGKDSGVIQEETVVSEHGGGSSTPVATAVPAVNQKTLDSTDISDNSTSAAENTPERSIDNNVSAFNISNNTPKPPAVKAVSGHSTVSKPSPTAKPKKNETAVSTSAVQTPEVRHETTAPAKVQEETQNEARTVSDDCEIAAVSVEAPAADANIAVARAYTLDDDDYTQITAQAEKDVEEQYSLASTGDIAKGRYYRHDKDGNPITEEEPPKAIGNIKISSEDADRAMDVILQYTHGVKGDLYSTDSANLTLMLSSLSKEGVGYTNYIPAYEGEIEFKLVIS